MALRSRKPGHLKGASKGNLHLGAVPFLEGAKSREQVKKGIGYPTLISLKLSDIKKKLIICFYKRSGRGFRRKIIFSKYSIALLVNISDNFNTDEIQKSTKLQISKIEYDIE